MEYSKGNKFIWNPINRATNKVQESHPHYNKIVTMISEETLNRIKISVDDFPQCNHRELKNQFCADKEELIPYNPMELIKNAEMQTIFING